MIIERIKISDTYSVVKQHKESDLKKRFAEVVDERNLLLDALIEANLADDEFNAAEKDIILIEQITEKPWEEIKELRK